MDGQTGIQVGVILKQVFNEFVLKGKGIEDGVVGPKFDEGTVGCLGRFYRVFGHQLPARKAHQLGFPFAKRSEEHTSELQSRPHLVCRILLEKKKERLKRSQLLLNFTSTS